MTPSLSTLFHTVETVFPRYGKSFSLFSTPWKIGRDFFHAVENFFPRRGKSSVVFSTLWKTVLAGLMATSAAASPFGVSAEHSQHDGAAAIRVAFEIPADHNLYSGFSVTDPDGQPLDALLVPAPDTFKPDDPTPSHSASFAAFYAPPRTDTIVVAYQGCKGDMCFLPEEVTLRLDPVSAAPAPAPPSTLAASTSPPEGDWLAQLTQRGPFRTKAGSSEVDEFLAFLDPSMADPATETSSWRLFLDDPSAFYLRFGVWPVVLLILVGGFLLNLTPCVLPMIPINLAIIGASSLDVSRRGRFGLGLVYGLGMALVYGALGLGVVLFGAVFGALQGSPVFNGSIAVLFLVLALAMFDVFHIDFSRFRKSGGISGRVRIPAVLALGGISAILAGACVAPVLIAVLALSASLYVGDAQTLAILLPFLLGVGMALPWPLAAAGLAVLPKPGAWMEKVKIGFGILILLLALFYGWNTLRALRLTPAAPATATAGTSSIPYRTVVMIPGDDGGFESVVHEALASGKPIIFNFGATWCIECKVMDAGTLSDPVVVDTLQEYFPIKVYADQPRRPPARDLLAPFSIPGFPTYVIVPAP